MESRIIFRVTAFGDEVSQAKMHTALALVKGVELVEVESVEEAKRKAEGSADPDADPTIYPGSPVARYLLALLELHESAPFEDVSFPTSRLQKTVGASLEVVVREQLVEKGMVEYREDDGAPRVLLLPAGRAEAKRLLDIA